jgi:hypothetical protein
MGWGSFSPPPPRGIELILFLHVNFVEKKYYPETSVINLKNVNKTEKIYQIFCM